MRGCRAHHKAFDAGLIRFLGFTRADDALGEGLPVFLVVETNEILRPKPRRRPGSTAGIGEEQPAWLLRALGRRLRRRLRGRLRGRSPGRPAGRPEPDRCKPERRDPAEPDRPEPEGREPEGRDPPA